MRITPRPVAEHLRGKELNDEKLSIYVHLKDACGNYAAAEHRISSSELAKDSDGSWRQTETLAGGGRLLSYKQPLRGEIYQSGDLKRRFSVGDVGSGCDLECTLENAPGYLIPYALLHIDQNGYVIPSLDQPPSDRPDRQAS